MPSPDYSFAKVDFDRTFDENEEKVMNTVHEAFNLISEKDKSKSENISLQGTRTYIPTSRSEFSLLPNSSDFFSTSDGTVPIVDSTFPLGYVRGLKPNHELTFRPMDIAIEPPKLKDEKYRAHVHSLLSVLLHEGRYDSLYSWASKDTTTAVSMAQQRC